MKQHNTGIQIEIVEMEEPDRPGEFYFATVVKTACRGVSFGGCLTNSVRFSDNEADEILRDTLHKALNQAMRKHNEMVKRDDFMDFVFGKPQLANSISERIEALRFAKPQIVDVDTNLPADIYTWKKAVTASSNTPPNTPDGSDPRPCPE